MKKLLYLVLLFAVMTPEVVAQNSWESYEDKNYDNNGKHKGHPVTPEPEVYGAAIMGFAILLYLRKRGRLF